MATRYDGTARESRALDTFLKLLRASEGLSARLQQELLPQDITMSQLAVLDALHHVGPMSQRELGRRLMRSNANITTVLDNLERDGFVKRTRSKEDRRVFNVSLTAAGKQRIKRVFPAHAAAITELLGALSPAEQDKLGALCKKLGLAVQTQKNSRDAA